MSLTIELQNLLLIWMGKNVCVMILYSSVELSVITGTLTLTNLISSPSVQDSCGVWSGDLGPGGDPDH